MIRRYVVHKQAVAPCDKQQLGAADKSGERPGHKGHKGHKERPGETVVKPTAEAR